MKEQYADSIEDFDVSYEQSYDEYCRGLECIDTVINKTCKNCEQEVEVSSLKPFCPICETNVIDY